MSKVTRTEASSEEQSSKPVQADDITETSPDGDSLNSLMERLESAIHRLKLAADDFSDLAETVPAGEHGSAAFIVAEVVRDLNLFYKDLDAWESTHECTPRDMQPLMEHLRKIEMEPGGSDESMDIMLHGRPVLPI